MLRTVFVWALGLALAATGCDCRGDTGDPGIRDGGRRDAGPMIDTGPPIDVGMIDSGPVTPPDAGTTCACPPLPDTCQPPMTDTPVFGPTDTNEILAQLLGLISCADTSLHLAAYETTFVCLVDAIAARLEAAPGLQVDLVIDDGMCPLEGGMRTCPWNAIETHPRVRIVADTRTAYMHHKFAIADGDTLWVASSNFTRTSYCTDHNNALVVTEPAIVARYEEVFQRMHASMGFGPVAPEPPVTGGPYTVYFSPESPADTPPAWFDDMIAAIGAATTSVEFLMFAFTRDEVTMALTAAHMRGVAVRGVVANEYAGDPAVQALVTAGIEVHEGNVHDKVLIIDGNLVITGSPNWSANAWSNNENSLWIRDPDIAAAYDSEGDALFDSTPPAMPSM